MIRLNSRFWILSFALTVGCQSSRVLYHQEVGPDHRDEFAVFQTADDVYFFKVDCQDSHCQVRECTDSSYRDCPLLLGECKNTELVLMHFKNSGTSTSEVRVCKKMEKIFASRLKEIGLTRFAKLRSKTRFEGSISKDDFLKARDHGYSLDLTRTLKPIITYDPKAETARCEYNGLDAHLLRFGVNTEKKSFEILLDGAIRPNGVRCVLPEKGLKLLI